jgi:hypothetical protein
VEHPGKREIVHIPSRPGDLRRVISEGEHVYLTVKTGMIARGVKAVLAAEGKL